MDKAQGKDDSAGRQGPTRLIGGNELFELTQQVYTNGQATTSGIKEQEVAEQ